MRRVICLLLFLGWAAVPAAHAGDAPDHPITLREALEMLRANNATLAAGRSHQQAVKASEITAALRPNPQFSSSNQDFNVFRPSRFDLNNQEFTQGLLFVVERGGKRQRRIESAQWDTRVGQQILLDTQRQLEFAVKSAFVSMLLAKANLQLAHDNLRDYQETVRLNELRMKAGDISPTDFDRIRGQQVQFETDALNAQLALDQARIQLEALLGLTGMPAQFDIQGELDAPELKLSQDELMQKALASRPDYVAAQNAVNKAQADVRLADANGATDFSIGPEYKRNGPENTLGFDLQIPLRIFDRNQGEKARTRRELEATRSGELAAATNVRADVAQSYQAYRVALSRAQLYSKDYLERARRIRERVEFSFRNGGSSLLDYLDALRTYRDTELAWRAAYAQVMTSLHQLSFVTGTEIWP